MIPVAFKKSETQSQTCMSTRNVSQGMPCIFSTTPMVVKRILKINNSRPELFNFQNSFNCY